MPTISIRDSGVEPAVPASFFAAGFRPFFLLGAVWAAIAVPLWLAVYAHGFALGVALPPVYWHAHEMIFGYGLAAVAGFLLTAIPNWTGRLPVAGAPLAALAGVWLVGRLAAFTPLPWLDVAFPAALILVVARELVAGRNWRNLPVLAVLTLLLAADTLVYLEFPVPGIRIGLALLLTLIALVGGRIIPSFTRNWLVKARPGANLPAPMGGVDRVCLALTIAGLAAFAADSFPALEILGGTAAAVRLARWRGLATIREPLLFILHLGYAWLAFGLLLAGANGLLDFLPPSAALHALSVGAVGTMTLAVMTRASLGHSGRPLVAGRGTTLIYVLVTLAALLRVASPLGGADAHELIGTSGMAWTAAFALFAILYAPLFFGKKS